MLRKKQFWISTLGWALVLLAMNLLIEYATDRSSFTFPHIAARFIIALTISFLGSLFVFREATNNNSK